MSKATNLFIDAVREELRDDADALVVVEELRQAWRSVEATGDFAAKQYYEQRAANLLLILDIVS